MRMRTACLVGLAAIAGAEGFSAWWMRPTPIDPDLPVLEWNVPGGADWKALPDDYDEVDQALLCTSGWIGQVESGGRPVRVSFFRWDHTKTVNTLEAFDHLPEVCMGSVGMQLQRRYEPRVLDVDGRPVRFDVTFFRPEHGLGAVYLYKAIVVAGHEQAGLRSGIDGFSIRDLRRLRLAATWNRFRPPHTRVVMAGISDVPSEEIAWREFRSIVQPQLHWTKAGDLSSSTKKSAQ